MKNIKKGVLIILILFNIFFPTISFAEDTSNSPVTLTTGLPFFPKDCTEIENEDRKESLCYKDTSGEYTRDYNSKGLIKEVFEGIFRFILGSAGTLCVIMLIVSGLQIAFAAGNANILGAARGRMKDSVIGLILTVSSGFILTIINPQLLDFDFKEPSDYVISGFQHIEGTEFSKCVNNESCNYGLYCYKENEDDITGICKKYLQPGVECDDKEECINGYSCQMLSIPDGQGTYYYQCVPEENIKVEENSLCIALKNNCKDGYFCYEGFPTAATHQGICKSCIEYYDGTYRNITSEIEKSCLTTKEPGEICEYDRECEIEKCISRGSQTKVCAECLTNEDCNETIEFCNITGKDIYGTYSSSIQYTCEPKKDLGTYCENNKECDSGQCEGNECVCGVDTDCPIGQKCMAIIMIKNYCYIP